MKYLLLIFNFFKKFFKPISIILFFIPIIIKNWNRNKKNNNYYKSLYKIKKNRDGEDLKTKRKRYNKSR